MLHCNTIGTGPDLVILHGLFGDGENWRSQAQRLSSTFRVHSMDLRNHGQSPHTSNMNYHAMAADVAETCKSLKISQTHILGHSMGGKTAMRLALDNNSLLDKLVIVDIGPRQYPRHHDQIIEGLQHLQSHNLQSRGEANKLLEPFVESPAIRSFLLKNLRRTDESGYSLRINLNTIAACYDEIAAGIESDTPYAGSAIFIKGENSDYLPAKDQTGVFELFPKAQLKIVEGAGHWPHSEKPDIVFKTVNDFLSGND